MQNDNKSTTNENKSKKLNQFQAAFKEEANTSQLHSNNENKNRSRHKRNLSEESSHFHTSCSNKRRQNHLNHVMLKKIV